MGKIYSTESEQKPQIIRCLKSLNGIKNKLIADCEEMQGWFSNELLEEEKDDCKGKLSSKKDKFSSHPLKENNLI